MNRTNSRKTSSRTASRTRSKGFLARSPEQTRQVMSDTVRRGVAVVTGVVEGYATEIKEGDLPGNAEKAVHLTGQTARRFAETGAYELAETRRRVRKASQSIPASKGKTSARKSARKTTKVSSRGGRASRTRASSKRAVLKLKRSVSRKVPAIKRKVAARKNAIKRSVKSAKRTIARKMPMAS